MRWVTLPVVETNFNRDERSHLDKILSVEVVLFCSAQNCKPPPSRPESRVYMHKLSAKHAHVDTF
eukprot:6330544-Amphidinium_carterae.1